MKIDPSGDRGLAAIECACKGQLWVLVLLGLIEHHPYSSPYEDLKLNAE